MFGRLKVWTPKRPSPLAEGERHLAAGNFAEAGTHFAAALADAEKRRAAPATQILLRLQLAECQRRQKEFEAAQQTLNGAIVLTAREGNTEAYIECLDALAEVFEDVGALADAHKTLAQAGRLEAALSHPDRRNIARRAWRAALAKHRLGHDAGPLLEQAIALHEQAFGPGEAETGDRLTDLGGIYHQQGRHADAQRCLRQALEIHERAPEPDSLQVLRDLQHLSASLDQAGDPAAAAAQHERLLTHVQSALRSNVYEVAEAQLRVAESYLRWGNYSRARELLTEAIGAYRFSKGPRLAAALERLAHVEEISGHFKAAISELRQAASIWESSGAEHAAELKRNMLKRADLHALLNETEDAAWLRDIVGGLGEPQAAR